MDVPSSRAAEPRVTVSDRRDHPRLGSTIAASLHLGSVSFRRLFVSRQTLISLFLSGLGCLIVFGWSMRDEPTVKLYVEEMLLPVHVAFLLPIFAICYGTSAIAGEREERTLVYLLITPLPRPIIYFVKYLAAMTLIVTWTLGSAAAMGYLARPWGVEVLSFLWPALLLGALAYGSLFHALGATFRRGTIISLAYAFFFEGLIGNMPGIVKRVSLSFYISCMIYDAGAEYEIGPRVAPEMFLPIEGRTAAWVLSALVVFLFLVGLAVFTRSEYRDAA